MKKIKIKYNGKIYQSSPYLNTLDFIKEHKIPSTFPVASIVNGHLVRLDKNITVDSTLDVIELKTYQGQRIYESSILFLFVVAFSKNFPDFNVFIQHSVPGGIFAEIKERPLYDKEIKNLQDYMNKLTKEELPIKYVLDDWEQVQSKLLRLGRQDIINLYRYHSGNKLGLYELENIWECLYLPLLPNTKYLNSFKLSKFHNGVVISFPDFEKGINMKTKKNFSKLFKTYKEYHQWSRILKIRTVGQLNKYIINDKIGNLIRVTESLHEKKVANIADLICSKEFIPKVILIAGPSSSGKTTFAKRLDIQLRVNGLNPISISLDNYFLNRNQTPLDENGEYDFESLNAIDVPLLTDHLKKLLKGEEIITPSFDFRIGEKSFPKQNKLKLGENQLLIIEGIHGINPKLTEGISKKYQFKIYVSALTQLNLHRHDRVPTSDTRLIRRIVRDSSFRGYSANETLHQWKKVRSGEAVNIFPFQEEADIIFNSALFYELSVLKGQAERELLKVEKDHPMYSEARRLLTFLSFFLPLESLNVPKTSILREFIGGSSFNY